MAPRYKGQMSAEIAPQLRVHGFGIEGFQFCEVTVLGGTGELLSQWSNFQGSFGSYLEGQGDLDRLGFRV